MKIKSILLVGVLVACFACENKPVEEVKVEQPRENHLAKGNDFLLKSDFENATKEFDLSIKDSATAGAYYGKGVISSMQNDYTPAIEYYSKAISMDPNFALAYYMRASSKRMMGDQSALEDMKKTIELKPDFVTAIVDVAHQEAASGKVEQAIVSMLTKSIQAQPNSSILYQFRGKHRYSLNDIKGAIEDFDQVMKLKPNEEAYYYRGLLYGETKEYAKSVSDLSKSIEFGTKNSSAYIYRGIYHYHLGDTSNACKDFVKAKELGESSAQQYIKDYCK